MPSTRFKSTVQIGTTALVALAAGVSLYVAGGLNVKTNLNFVPTGTTTGAVIQVNGVTGLQIFPTACTSTGGLTKYPTCIASSPFSTTGALVDVAIDCGNTKVAMLLSGSFVKSNAATIFGTPVLKKVTVGTGGLANRLAQSGAQLSWNPADKLRLTTTTTQPNTAANCTMWVTARDKSGN